MKQNLYFNILFFSFVFIFILSACGQAEQSIDEKKVVYTSFYPIYYIAENISQGVADVRLVIPNGAEVHSYNLSLRKMTRLEDADVLFYNGVGLERWADRVRKNLSKKGVRVIRVSDAVELITNDEDYIDDHKHSDNHKHHEHSHGENDPHIWLNPLNMKKIAYKIKEELVSIDGENKKVYQRNYIQLAGKLENLDKDYQKVLAKRKNDYILVSHAAFAYLAERYGLKQLAVTGVSSHQEPSPKKLVLLSKKAREHDLKYIFMETLANPKTATVLAKEAKLKILTLNTIAGLTKKDKENKEDYISLMRKNLSNLEKALVK